MSILENFDSVTQSICSMDSRAELSYPKTKFQRNGWTGKLRFLFLSSLCSSAWCLVAAEINPSSRLLCWSWKNLKGASWIKFPSRNFVVNKLIIKKTWQKIILNYSTVDPLSSFILCYKDSWKSFNLFWKKFSVWLNLKVLLLRWRTFLMWLILLEPTLS